MIYILCFVITYVCRKPKVYFFCKYRENEQRSRNDLANARLNNCGYREEHIMNLPFQVNQSELKEILLNIAPIRPVFIWGAPGIGKSAIVEQFAEEVGMECVSLLGSQLAPEDIIGIPRINGETSEFLPPKMIARKEPYVLFLDELNACSQEVQKSFYSLIHEHRVGEYHLPEKSVVIGAGNRSQDGAIVKMMSSALVNRMFHVQLVADSAQWLDWAYQNDIHPWVIDYITNRPDHLFSEPPKTEEPYSTPRSWHMLSDALHEYHHQRGWKMAFRSGRQRHSVLPGTVLQSQTFDGIACIQGDVKR